AEVDVRFDDALPEPGLAMLVAVPVVHGRQPLLRMANRELRSVGEDVEVAIGDDRGDLQDGVVVRIEPSHFEVDPDQVAIVDSVHAHPAWPVRSLGNGPALANP